MQLMGVVRMRELGDCEEASIGTATGKTWEEVHAALWKDGVGNDIEDPVCGNPENVKRACALLGFDARDRTWADIHGNQFAAGKLLFLAHLGPKDQELSLKGEIENTLKQHWVVITGRFTDAQGTDCFIFEWGNSRRIYPIQTVLRFFKDGWPNCALELVPIGRAVKFWRWLWSRLTGKKM